MFPFNPNNSDYPKTYEEQLNVLDEKMKELKKQQNEKMKAMQEAFDRKDRWYELEIKRLQMEEALEFRKSNRDEDMTQISMIPCTCENVISCASVHNETILTNTLKAFKSDFVSELPEFDGKNPLEWFTLVTEYKRSTEEYDISAYDNLLRLRKALKGEAKEIVYPFLSDVRYLPLIFQILEKQYARKEVIMDELIHKLLSFDKIKNLDLQAFKQFYNLIFTTIYAAKTVGAMDYINFPQLLVHMSNKLPDISKVQWLRVWAQMEREANTVTIETFLAWLESEMDIVHLNDATENCINEENLTVFSHVQVKNHEKRIQKCRFCKSTEHSVLERCKKFTKLSVQERRSACLKLCVCFLCLKAGHSSKRCRKKEFCRKCGAKHHKLMHRDEDQKPKFTSKTVKNPNLMEETENKTLNTTRDSNEIEEKPPNSEANSSNSNTSQTKQKLPTVPTQVQESQNSVKKTVKLKRKILKKTQEKDNQSVMKRDGSSLKKLKFENGSLMLDDEKNYDDNAQLTNAKGYETNPKMKINWSYHKFKDK